MATYDESVIEIASLYTVAKDPVTGESFLQLSETVQAGLSPSSFNNKEYEKMVGEADVFLRSKNVLPPAGATGNNFTRIANASDAVAVQLIKDVETQRNNDNKVLAEALEIYETAIVNDITDSNGNTISRKILKVKDGVDLTDATVQSKVANFKKFMDDRGWTGDPNGARDAGKQVGWAGNPNGGRNASGQVIDGAYAPLSEKDRINIDSFAVLEHKNRLQDIQKVFDVKPDSANNLSLQTKEGYNKADYDKAVEALTKLGWQSKPTVQQITLPSGTQEDRYIFSPQNAKEEAIVKQSDVFNKSGRIYGTNGMDKGHQGIIFGQKDKDTNMPTVTIETMDKEDNDIYADTQNYLGKPLEPLGIPRSSSMEDFLCDMFVAVAEWTAVNTRLIAIERAGRRFEENKQKAELFRERLLGTKNSDGSRSGGLIDKMLKQVEKGETGEAQKTMADIDTLTRQMPRGFVGGKGIFARHNTIKNLNEVAEIVKNLPPEPTSDAYKSLFGTASGRLTTLSKDLKLKVAGSTPLNVLGNEKERAVSPKTVTSEFARGERA